MAPLLIRLPGTRGLTRLIEIVLTTAHLNHRPQDNHHTNLAALCQRCHLAHDRLHHQSTRRARLRAQLGTPDLFLGA